MIGSIRSFAHKTPAAGWASLFSDTKKQHRKTRTKDQLGEPPILKASSSFGDRIWRVGIESIAAISGSYPHPKVHSNRICNWTIATRKRIEHLKPSINWRMFYESGMSMNEITKSIYWNSRVSQGCLWIYTPGCTVSRKTLSNRHLVVGQTLWNNVHLGWINPGSFCDSPGVDIFLDMRSS